MNFFSYTRRRGIKLNTWLASKQIHTYKGLCVLLKEISVEPPTEKEMTELGFFVKEEVVAAKPKVESSKKPSLKSKPSVDPAPAKTKSKYKQK